MFFWLSLKVAGENMLGQFRIDDIADEIRQDEPIFRRDELSFTEGPLDLYEGTLVVLGDGGAGCVVRGQGNVIIQGGLEGNTRMPARIDVEGDVVIMGDVSNATVEANRVFVGKNISDAQINARSGLEVGGDLSASRVRVGDYDLDRKKIDHLKKRLDDAVWEREATERKLRMDEKRVDKLFKNTRMILAANVGRILQGKRNRLVVNLDPIYASLEGRNEQEVDKALQEFFAKAIVGLLTRANQHFLMSKNRHRQEIFKGVIRDVHDLFFLARKFDKQTRRCATLKEVLDEAIASLQGRVVQIYVGGKCAPELAVSITLPDVHIADDDRILISGDMVRAEISVSDEVGRLNIKQVNTVGVASQQVVGSDDLSGCRMAIFDAGFFWQPLNKDASVGV